MSRVIVRLRLGRGLDLWHRRVWDYVAEYASSNRRRCFTLRGLMEYWPRSPIPVSLSTLEKRLNELVDMGRLRVIWFPREDGRVVPLMYCLFENHYYAIA